MNISFFCNDFFVLYFRMRQSVRVISSRFYFSSCFLLCFLLYNIPAWAQKSDGYKEGKRIYKLLSKSDGDKVFTELVELYRATGYDVYFGLQYKVHRFDEPLSRYLANEELITFPAPVKRAQADSLWQFWSKEFTASIWQPSLSFPSEKQRKMLGNFMSLLIVAHEMGHHIEKRYNVEMRADACFELTPNYFAIATINYLSAYPPMAKLREEFLQLCNEFYGSLVKDRLEIPAGANLLTWCETAVFKKYNYLYIDVPFYISAVVAQWIELMGRKQLPSLDEWHDQFHLSRQQVYFDKYVQAGITGEVTTVRQSGGFYGNILPGRVTFDLNYEDERVNCFSGITPSGKLRRLEISDHTDYDNSTAKRIISYRLLEERKGADSLMISWEDNTTTAINPPNDEPVYAYWNMVTEGAVIRYSPSHVSFSDSFFAVLSKYVKQNTQYYQIRQYNIDGSSFSEAEWTFQVDDLVPNQMMVDFLFSVKLVMGNTMALILEFKEPDSETYVYYQVPIERNKMPEVNTLKPFLEVVNAADIDPDFFTADASGNLYFYNTEGFQVMACYKNQPVFLAGSRRGLKDGSGRDAAFAEVRGMSFTNSGNLIVIDGMPGIPDQYYIREIKLTLPD